MEECQEESGLDEKVVDKHSLGEQGGSGEVEDNQTGKSAGQCLSGDGLGLWGGGYP